MPDFDVIAIGGGAAGLTIAIGGAGLGLRVALVERHRTGGECTWTGCVPSKALLHVASLAAAGRRAASLSTDGAPAPAIDFAKAIGRVRTARETIGHEESPAALERKGITVLKGAARLRAGGAIEVDGRTYSARHVVVATGSDPALVPIPGLSDARYLTNETVFDELDEPPTRLGIIGGGPIGCELAQAFARLGSRVELFEAAPRLLVNEEEHVAPVIQAALESDGVVVRTGATIARVMPSADGGRGATLTLEGQGEFAVDALLVATGRRARTADLGLEEIGVRVGKNGIEVDEFLRTGAPGVWAIGDVVGPYRFTHVAEMHGRTVLRNILFPWRKQKFDDRVIPWATFTDPEVGRVGLTEEQACGRHGGAVHVTTFPLSRVDRAIAEDATAGFIKLVLKGNTILGAHIVAPRAGELTQQVALVMRHKLPVSALSMVHVYPAYAYGLHQAGDRVTLHRFARSIVARRALPLLRRLALWGRAR